MKEVPTSLRWWFVIHFIVDTLFALPLLYFPLPFLMWLGFTSVEPVTARLVGAALLAIGGTSLIRQCAGRDSFQSLLTLKIIWSLGAIIGLLLSIYEGAPTVTWLFVGIFAFFSAIWIYYYQRVR